ncbi:histidine kinase [Skermanella stibiiresistens SB22]|uniref:Sensor protein FixL n=1 Tax=Skermanella stibiiresistens SB22 TaxID=1385369 RepID=W9H2V3_9PROT|nr:PAS domain S-box protein [Skermanella stibiiresistens]EWY38098.1 histidine kinase [Skermanella stibiiresistens SB22]
MPLKLVHRLLAVMGAALLPISAMQIHSTFQLEQQQVKSTHAEAMRLLQMIEAQQSAILSGVRQLLSMLRQTRVVLEGDWPQCQNLVERLRAEYPSHLSFHVTDERGIIRCATEVRAIGLDVSDRDHVAVALAGSARTGARITTRLTGRTVLPLAVPVTDPVVRNVIGVAVALIEIDWLGAGLGGKPLPPNSTLTVADRAGLILYRSPHTAGMTGTTLPDRFMELAFLADPGAMLLSDLDGVERLIAFSPVPHGGDDLFLSIGLDEAGALAGIRDSRTRTLWLLMVVAVGATVLVIWLGHRHIQTPAGHLAAVARRWRGGQLDARATVSPSAVEFASLAADFNAMADTLDGRQRALQTSEERHRAVFDTAVDALVVIDEGGTMRAANPAAARVFGYDVADLLGRDVSMLMGDEHRRRHGGYIDSYLKTGIARIIGIGRQVEGRRSDGTLFPLELSIAWWRDSEGQRFFTGIMRDISARRLAERQAEEERDRLRRVIEGAPFPMMVRAESGKILHISRAWLEISGYDRGELATIADWTERAYGRSGGMGVGNAVRADIDRLYALDRPIDEGEYVIRTATGAKRVWAFRSAPIGRAASGQRLVVSVAIDVTDRRDGEERLKLLMREVDHRAKNALMVVQSIVQLSRSDDPGEFFRAVEGRIQAMARAHSLLAIGQWSGADLRQLLFEELLAYGGEGRITLTGPAVSLRPEATQAVSLALHELATNAAKHGSLTSAQGRIEVFWSAQEAGDALCLLWQESGGPIGDGAPPRQGFGTELLRQVIESQLGGEMQLHLDSPGLACQITLPADTWQASGLDAPEPVSRHWSGTPVVGMGRRVMIVEDEALTALALQQLLERHGFAVLGPVGRVEDALELLRAGPPDAAVLDVNLFGSTIDPVAAALENMGVPFLFCTGYHAGGSSARRHPGAPVLNKPVNANNLLVAVNHLMTDAKPVNEDVEMGV